MSKPNIYDLEFAKRLEKVIAESGKSVNAFAKMLEVTPPTVSRWIKGEADPTRTNLIKLSEALGVSLQWLAIGVDEEKKAERNIVVQAFEQAKAMLDEGVSMISSYPSINVSAGFGSFNEGVTEPESEEPYADNLLAGLGVQPHKCAVFWANGDSMLPTIADGDQLLVDLTKTEVKGDNRIYLVQNGESVWVKRLRQGWGYIELISDNESYEPIKLNASDAQNLQIIGQVVHIGHSLI